jgi:hypothetical protein
MAKSGRYQMKRCDACGHLRKYLFRLLADITYTRNYQSKEVHTLLTGSTICHNELRSVLFSGRSDQQQITSSYDNKTFRYIRAGDRTQILERA